MRNKLWPKKKISWLFDVIGSGTTPSASNEMYYDSPDMAWLNTGDLTDSYIEKTSKYVSQQALDKFSALTVFPKDSLVMAMYGATIGKLGITKYETTTNQACCVLSKPRGVITKFIFYWLMGHRTEIINLSHGGGQPNISQGIIRNIRIAIPPLELQSKIVTFVDKKFEETNQLINKKEKMIKLLEQQRQSIITEAVTKGLNPNVKMKDSGIEWIGEIPEHWEISKLKYHAVRIGDGLHGTPVYDDQGEYHFINGNNLGDISIRFNEKTNKINKAEFISHGQKIGGNTILVSLNGTIGNVSIYNNEKIMLSKSAGFINLKNNIETLYVYYWLKSIHVENYFTKSFAGTTIKNLSLETLRNTPILIVPIIEQQQIAKYLVDKLKENDSLLEKVKIQIEKLKEYRQSLIYEAVTGKIDVSEMELLEVR